ncbi:homing endonuclease associated repeat-containing protein [Halorubrum halophilum]|uniref:homing endonuclease associated repeat-containing protein n=1 Tax=Halorubrum halophilum TaxID=413816 RepID=UPI0037423703
MVLTSYSSIHTWHSRVTDPIRIPPKKNSSTRSKISQDSGKTPTIKEIEKHTQYTAHIYTKHFGNNAVEKASNQTNTRFPSRTN